MAYARSGGPLYYKAPMDTHSVRITPLEGGYYTYKVRARTIRIKPPKHVADAFTADAGHLDRFRGLVETEMLLKLPKVSP